MPDDNNDDGALGSILGLIFFVPAAIVMWATNKILLATNMRQPEGELYDTKKLYEEARNALFRNIDHKTTSIGVDILSDAMAASNKTPHDDVLSVFYDFVPQLIRDACIAGDLDVERPGDMFMQRDISERVALRKQYRKIITVHTNYEHYRDIFDGKVTALLIYIINTLPDNKGDQSIESIQCRVVDTVTHPYAFIEVLATFVFSEEIRSINLLEELTSIFDANFKTVKGTSKANIYPDDPKQQKRPINDVAFDYLQGTPFLDLLEIELPFYIPFSTRFEHTHVLGGTGHGKTQFLQSEILKDLQKALEGKGAVVVIDGQGDLIRKITNLSYFDPDVEGSLADKLLLVDPNDIDYPVCLNMFDIDHEQLNKYSAVDRERIFNATIDLYEYFFGALLGAELTQKQNVIFKYLARLMFTIPDATIHTLLDVMENGEAYRPYMDTLDPTAQKFFQTQFFNKGFDDTKEQIARRLWGVLSNGTIERMFNNTSNKVNMFEAINQGKIVLINTAKNLLQADGSAIIGRFFIALLIQAAIQRQTIPENKRRSTFAYIDEIQDYIKGDNKIEDLLNQARKYKVGLICAHQNLDQLSSEQRATFAASTTTKYVGGLSSKDAERFADDMRTNKEFLLSMRKGKDHTNFACFVKNVTDTALKVSVPFGQMEEIETLSEDAYNRLIAMNRQKYCVVGEEGKQESAPTLKPPSPGGFDLGDHDLI